MLERKIEEYLTRQTIKLGGKSYKFSSPSNKAVPDRICIFPYGVLAFVECKATGKKPTPLQYKVHKYLRNLGQVVIVLDSKEQVDLFIENIKVELQKRKERWQNAK